MRFGNNKNHCYNGCECYWTSEHANLYFFNADHRTWDIIVEGNFAAKQDILLDIKSSDGQHYSSVLCNDGNLETKEACIWNNETNWEYDSLFGAAEKLLNGSMVNVHATCIFASYGNVQHNYICCDGNFFKIEQVPSGQYDDIDVCETDLFGGIR